MRPILKTEQLLTISMLVIVACMTIPELARASTSIGAGFELYQTEPPGISIDFTPVPNPQVVVFQGNPLGTFDFGTGPVSVGPADTIIERTQDPNLASGSDTIDIEIVALSLVSTGPVDLGFGAGFEDLFLTLNTSSPSTQSTMNLLDAGEGSPHGTFGTTVNFAYDVTGSVGGFYATVETVFISTGNSWQHAPTGTPLIPGVNHLLDGSTENSDFWLDGLAVHADAFAMVTYSSAGPPPSGGGAIPSLPAWGLAALLAVLLGTGVRRLSRTI